MRRVIAGIARRYAAGPLLADALAVSERLRDAGLSCTIGYWNAAGEPFDHVQEQADAAAAALDRAGLDGYVSLKAPAFGYSDDLVRRLSASPVHFDAMRPDSVLPTMDLARRHNVGVTLPSRWMRSDADAEDAVTRSARIRIVKGQWPDPVGGNRDPREGYVALVDRLAGRATEVAVATHDVPLACAALRRLRAAGTRCNLELLYGLPIRRVIDACGETTARVYVPYGTAYLPYALREVCRRPRILLWMMKDLGAGATTLP